MAINSAQGIASLYRGNPQPLQQSIQKEQQAKPGLPPDLQKMLALQIVTNEKDAAAAQAAMQQLKQMSGPTGQMPTVMASLEQQAKQKIQAQQQQARQQAEQRGLPAGLMGVQGEPPQPEMQPEAQGIDQSDRVEFAGAEGGIVAFQNRGEVPDEEKYETPYDRRNRKNREEEAAEEERRAGQPVDPQTAADRAMFKRLVASIKGGSEDAGRAIADVATMVPRGLVGAYDTAVVRPMRAAGINAAYLSPKLTPDGANPESMTPFSDVKTAREAAKNAQAQATTATDNRAAINKADAASRAMPAAPAAPVRDLKELNTQRVNAASPPAAAQPPAPPPPSPPPAPEVVDPAAAAAKKVLDDRVAADPAAAAAAEAARMDKELGRPDTSSHDRLIAELEKRKQDLAPKQGYEGLMEYLSQISANSQPGRGSFASGAAGARGLDKLNQERKLEQFELSKQAIDVSQKKLDTVRAYAEKRFNVGKTEFDKVYKDQLDAAKEVVKNKADADKLAKENTLKILQMQNNLDVQALQNKGSLAAASVRASATGGGDKQQLAELKALQTSLKDQLKDPRMIGKAGDSLRAQLARVNAAVAQMAGLGTMGAAPGAERPGGIPPDVQALLNKYGGK